jgi:hypothetical protein
MRWQRMFCEPDRTGRIRKDGQTEDRNPARFRSGKESKALMIHQRGAWLPRHKVST